MNNKFRNIITVSLCGAFIFLFCILSIVMPDKEVSESERRKLSQLPQVSAENILSGRFMQKFDDYSMDQFVFRDKFRTVRAMIYKYVLRRSDKDNIYIKNGYLSQLMYQESDKSVENAADKFTEIYNKYLKDSNTNVYLSVIPDKNMFLTKDSLYPSLDYIVFADKLKSNMQFADYIDIYDRLELSDYYKTDTHWRQEKIIDVADTIAKAMNSDIEDEYEVNAIENTFYGVYYGQAALPIPGEKLYYLTNGVINDLTVFDHETNSDIAVYNMESARGRDPYEMFLSGSKSLLTVKNPRVQNDKRLIIFRDSFGSSISPLLATGYSETVIIDIRYVSSELLGNLVNFDNADVLFLYSTLVLNNSITLK